MGAVDLTSEFRALVEEKRKELPDTKRRRLNRPSRRVPGEKENDSAPPLMQQYTQEAYNILKHIHTLSRMLATIRRPYLDVHARRPPLARQAGRALDFGDVEQSWADVKYLSNEERDEIDMQARVILARCADRVKDMEALEKRREELARRDANPLLRMLPARLRHDAASAASDFVAAHNAGVTWYLARRLAEAGQAQRDMQAERVRRQTERTRTLGSGAAREALQLGAVEVADGASSWLGGLASTLGAPGPSLSTLPPVDFAELELEEDEEDVELTQSQIQQFESENAQILRGVEDTLAAVQQAETRLLEISALQMELVVQLSRQTEVTDQLYEDAIATTAFVETGNVQLREARRRARDGRMWKLLFLIGATLSLLFLHYY